MSSKGERPLGVKNSAEASSEKKHFAKAISSATTDTTDGDRKKQLRAAFFV